MATRRLTHAKSCSGWPEYIDERGRVACSCGHTRRRPRTLRKDLKRALTRVALGERVRKRLRAFWGRR